MLDNCFRFAPRDSIPGLIAKICKYLKEHPGWSEKELEEQIKKFISATCVESFNGRIGNVTLDKNDVNNLKIASAYFAEGDESIDSLDLVSLYNQGVRFVFTDFNSVTSGYNLAFVLDYFDASGEVVYYPVSTCSGGGGNIVSVNGKTGEVHLKVVDVSNGNSPDENAYIFIDESDDYPDVISSDSSKLGGQLPSYYASAEDVSQLKGDIDSFTYVERSPNLFNKNDKNITSNAQILSNGEVGVSSAWGSSVTDFIKINATGSRTLRQTLATNIKIGEYKADGTFISVTSINSSSPMTLNDETEKIRIEFWGTSGLMVYQSDTSLPYQDYYVNIIVNEDSIPTAIARKNDVEIELSLLDDRVSSLEEYEITNYALFVDTYEGKAYDSNGKLTNNANCNATSICKLDRTKPIRPSNIYTGHAVFFDENKSYISTVNCRSDYTVGVSEYPENAVYVAFDYYRGAYECGEWGTYWKNVTRNSSLQNVSLSHTKKRKNTRPVINIYTTNTQMEILAKLCDAFHTEDCDVVFERGEYTFDSVFVEMYEKGQRNYIELPIGGRCRYYFNGSTLIADRSVFNKAGYSATISLVSCIYNLNSSESYELYDGTLIGKGITYVVHDECGGKPNWYSHRYKNMKFVYQTDSQKNAIRKPIGGGTGLFGESIFENCTFETDNTLDLSFHGIATDKEDVSDFKLVLSNCYLSKRISLDNLATNQTASLMMSGCSAKYIHPTGTTNKWDVKSWCNEVRTE